MRVDPFTTLLLAVGLAMDSFSVSICSGATLNGSRIPQALRIGAVMGGFQAAMPVLGWLGGSALSDLICRVDHWIAFGLLLFIGGRMVYEAIWGDGDCTMLDASRWRVLLGLGVATSIDALAVGLTLAVLGTSILVPVLAIGAVAFGLSFVGVLIGCQAGRVLRDRVPALGGVILIGIGAKILVDHLSPAFGV